MLPGEWNKFIGNRLLVEESLTGMLEFFHDAIEILWFITEELILTCNISTEAREIKPFLVCGKYIILLQ